MSIYRRFFVDKSDITGNTVDLTCQYQHISKVLRMRVGDTVIVCCGDNIEHTCNIDSITANTVTATIVSSRQSDNESICKTTLYMGILKGDKVDLVVQKAVELGVCRIVLFDSQYTVGQVNDNKLARYCRIAEEAVKQCDRAVRVDVQHINSIDDIASHQLTLLCYERAEHYTVARCIADNNYPLDIGIVIGSEGGFCPQEVQQLTDKGCQIVTLGKRILRAETAPMYVLSVIDSLYSEVPIED